VAARVHRADQPANEHLFTGIALAVLAIGFATVYDRTHGIAWVAPLIGAWAIVAPWVVRGPTPSDDAKLSNVIIGAVVVLCALSMMGVGLRSVGMRRRRMTAAR
jgi:SPW repeat